MSNNILQTYIAEGTRVLARMEKESLCANELSRELLMRLVRENEDTEYGRKYGFRDIHSYADYAAKVPYSGYEDYEPYIERMLCFHEKNLISSAETVYYAHTSGTSGASKLIPCSQAALDIFSDILLKRVFSLYDESLREATGKGMPECRGINLMESRPGYTPSGTAHGSITESLNRREETDAYNALPEELIYPTAEFDRRHVKMLFALRERKLSFMMATFSPTIYDMVTYLRGSWKALCDDLEAGRISPDIAVDPVLRKKLNAMLTPDPERASEIRAIMAAHADGAFIPLLWPDMKLIVTIGTASFAPYIEKLRQALGSDIATDQLTYACSEATIGAPLRENESEYMLLPEGGFYEFILVDDDAPKEPVLMDALEAGKEYEIILTNLSGFYRYRLGDVVRVTGYHNECLMLVFSYRKNQLISMYGEKMTETALRTAVEAMAEESGTTILEFSVYADASTDPGHYAVLMESDEEITPDRWPTYSEILNRKLCEAHDSYRKKIVQKTMRPAEAKFVQPQTYALYRDLKVMGGASPNQIKPIHVITEGRLKRFFFGLLQK